MDAFTITNVINERCCSGCGACAVVSSDLAIDLDVNGCHTVNISRASPDSLRRADSVCPFSDSSSDETVLGAALFSQEEVGYDARVGYYEFLGAGAITDPIARERSSSGGLTDWFLQQLIESGRVDGIIHVGASDQPGVLFGYSISRTIGEMKEKKKSKYYVTEMSQVLQRIRGDGLRYAFVGVPCFVTAARHIASIDMEYKEQLRYFIGLVCGHLKSTRFAELMAWQVGVPPEDLADVDFRIKTKEGRANEYHFAAKSRSSGAWKSSMASSLYGGDWGHAFFQLKACDYCDDIFAETADVVFGDAWIPRYEADWLGTNIVVSRRHELSELLRLGMQSNAITLDRLDLDEFVNSQSGNFRHRRTGLALRLKDALRRGERVPRKRITAGGADLPWLRRRIVRLRQRTASTSHHAYARARKIGDLSVFFAEMRPITNAVAQTYRLIRLMTLRGAVGAALRLLGLKR